MEEESFGGWNMAVDEALLRSYRHGDAPIFRLYRWNPALTFGRYSKPAEALDLDSMKKYGVEGVRRITGGGILVHGGDISYSIVLPAAFAKRHGVKESYRLLCQFLIRFYEKLGLPAGFAAQEGLPERRSPICLAGREAYDIVVGERKIGGNAQRHTRTAMLQHGSIPLRYDKERFETLFAEASGFGESLSLETLGVVRCDEDLTPLLIEAFGKAMDADLFEDTMQREEEDLADRLFETKYKTAEWNIDGKEPSEKA
ncbi:lipoate--protein ligase [Hydrogenimonas cancrithermarum]|uniref:Lipoate--protein ligase n=1 Tax=Hydrogenimonas cancrithermarum TaxID=2993563 RepID=A0ABM8FJF7_9BACT|nr:lipoate--protein ligase [Hydrogenimonas cancrithermarum]